MGVALKVFTKDRALFDKLKTWDKEALLASPVSSIPFSSRALNGLKREQIHTVGMLVSKSRFDLLKIRGLGKKAIDQVEFYLKELGLRLRVDAASPASGMVVFPAGSSKPLQPEKSVPTARELELEQALRQAQDALQRLTKVLS